MRIRQAHIDIDALQHNYRIVRQHAPTSAILAMLKSNAYGHGLEHIALGLPEVEGFGVACVREVERLREVGVQQTIVLMTGFHTTEELQLLHRLRTTLVVHNLEQLQLLQQTPLQPPISIWLKVDIGMSRLGFAIADIPAVLQQLRSIPTIDPNIVLCGHFSHAFDLHSSRTPQQLAQFHQLVQECQLPASLVNSAGILTLPAAHYQWVRPGIMLFGVTPCDNFAAQHFDLRPVMTLKSRLLAVRVLPKDTPVSYGGLYTCPETMPVGVVEMGYGDGYPRHAVSGTPTLIHGQRCPLVGTVCMDMMMVDLRNAPQAKVGDEVVLWGQQLPIEEVAASANTIGYELLCHVTQRVELHVSELNKG